MRDGLTASADTIDRFLDLGPGEGWLEPNPAAVASVKARLLEAGSGESDAVEGPAALIRLAGVRFQDVAALAVMSDGDMLGLITAAEERIDWLLAFIRYGHPAGGIVWRPDGSDGHPLRAFERLTVPPRVTEPGGERLRTLIRRATASDVDPAAAANTAIENALLEFQRDLSDLAFRLTGPVRAPPPEEVERFMPPSPAPDAIRDVQRAYLTGALSKRVGGRPAVPEALVDLVVGAATIWARCVGDVPPSNRDDDGRYYGPFIVLLHDLAEAYGFPQTMLSERVIGKAFKHLPRRQKAPRKR